MAHWSLMMNVYGPAELLESIEEKLNNETDWEPDCQEICDEVLETIWGDVSGPAEFYVDKFKTSLEKEFPGVTVDLLFDSLNGYGYFKSVGHRTISDYVLDWGDLNYYKTFKELLDGCKEAAEYEGAGVEYDIDWNDIHSTSELYDVLSENFSDYGFVYAGKVERVAGTSKEKNNTESVAGEKQKGILHYGMIFSADHKRLLYATFKSDGDYMVPEGVEVICRGAFNGRYICDLFLPTTLKEIEEGAISNCVITDSITSYAKEAPVVQEDIKECFNSEDVEFDDEDGNWLIYDDFNFAFSVECYYPDEYSNSPGWQNFVDNEIFVEESYEDYLENNRDDNPLTEEEWREDNWQLTYFDDEEDAEVEYWYDEDGNFEWCEL